MCRTQRRRVGGAGKDQEASGSLVTRRRRNIRILFGIWAAGFARTRRGRRICRLRPCAPTASATIAPAPAPVVADPAGRAGAGRCPGSGPRGPGRSARRSREEPGTRLVHRIGHRCGHRDRAVVPGPRPADDTRIHDQDPHHRGRVARPAQRSPHHDAGGRGLPSRRDRPRRRVATRRSPLSPSAKTVSTPAVPASPISRSRSSAAGPSSTPWSSMSGSSAETRSRSDGTPRTSGTGSSHPSNR